MDFCSWDFDFSEKPRNPLYAPPAIEENSLWLVDIYKNILNVDVNPETDDGHRYWMSEFSKGATRESIISYFRSVATKENNELTKVDIRDLFNGKRKKKGLLLLNGKTSDVFNSTSLFKSFKKKYPDHDLYFSCNPAHFDILNGNPYIEKLIPHSMELENEAFMVGFGTNESIVDFHCVLNASTDRFPNYISAVH